MDEEFLDIPTIFKEIKDKIDPLYGKHIACDEGWHHLVAKCHLEMMEIDPNYKIYQIKEKFGGLRYYFDTKLDYMSEYRMFQITSKYELLSQETCEKTGKPGNLKYKQGLYKTLSQDFEKEGWVPAEEIKYEKLFGNNPNATNQ